MDGLLDTLTPLAALLARTPDPSARCAELAEALRSGSETCTGEIIRQCFGADAADAPAALEHAGVTAGTRGWQVRLAQAEVLALEIRRARRTAPRLAMTVPDYLRPAWAEHLHEFPAAEWPRETWPAILDITFQAQRELLLAAPFLNGEHARSLAPGVARLTSAGGHVLLVTQGAATGPNREAVRLLVQASCEPGSVDVWSWPRPGLGIHFKAVAADRQVAYIGSANLTTHAALRHAEAGVILHGTQARQLDQWIRRIAEHPTREEALMT